MADELAANPPAVGMPAFGAALARLTPQQKLGGAIGIALLIAVLVGGLLWTREPPMAILFANFDERDGGDIMAALQQQNIPYKIAEGGRAVMIPQAQVHEVRLRLASQGLPKGGLVGFEVMEKQKLGISQFAEQVNYQRGLEGELSRTIGSLASVAGARVHLAIPKQSAFLRDEQKATASVVVNMRSGLRLEPAQISGIVHLVAASVPQLNPLNVSVIDQNGTLLSQPRNGAQQTLDPGQIGYVRELEADVVRRIEGILGPVVGGRNVRAQVTADVDFSAFEQVAENYKPNPAPETAIRSQQTSETGTGNPAAIGVPGAVSNQPPVPATAPLTQPPVAGGSAAGGAAAGINYARNATINYEVDKTIRHTKGQPGGIRRLSVAIVINPPTEPDKRTGKPVAVPLSADKLKQIDALAREAMGFTAARGDTINIAAAPFAAEAVEEVASLPIWKDAGMIALIKEIARYVLIALLLWFVWTRFLRPVVERMTPPPPPPVAEPSEAEKAGEAAELALEMAGEAHMMYEQKLAQAREYAKKDPRAVAHIIKEWMDGGAKGE